jgi:hypothetical protein
MKERNLININEKKHLLVGTENVFIVNFNICLHISIIIFSFVLSISSTLF